MSENTKNEIFDDATNIIKKIKSNNIEDSTHSIEHQHSVATEADEFSIWGTLNVHASQSTNQYITVKGNIGGSKLS